MGSLDHQTPDATRRFNSLASEPARQHADLSFLSQSHDGEIFLSPAVAAVFSGLNTRQMKDQLNLPSHLDVFLISKADIQSLWPPQLPSSATLSPSQLEKIGRSVVDFIQAQGFSGAIDPLQTTLLSLGESAQHILTDNALTIRPTSDFPLCLIGLQAEPNQANLYDTFLNVSGLTDPNHLIKISRDRTYHHTMAHELAHCAQPPATSFLEKLNNERLADADASIIYPEEGSLAARARLISGIHDTAIRSYTMPSLRNLEHSTEISLIKKSDFPDLQLEDLQAAYQEIGGRLIRSRLQHGDFETPDIRANFLQRIHNYTSENQYPEFQGKLEQLEAQLKGREPLKTLLKGAEGNESGLEFILLRALVDSDERPLDNLANVARNVHEIVTDRSHPLSPLSLKLCSLYLNAAADIQPSLEALRPLLPAQDNPLIDISGLMTLSATKTTSSARQYGREHPKKI